MLAEINQYSLSPNNNPENKVLDDTIHQYEYGDDDSNFDNRTYYPGLRRSIGHTAGNPSVLYGYDTDYVSLVAQVLVSKCQKDISLTYEAVSGEKSHVWLASMKDEINSLSENKLFELLQLPKSRKAVKTKWVYDLKTNTLEEVVHNKSHLVTKCFMQIEGVDYLQLFSPVARYSTFQFLIALSVYNDCECRGLDVNSAFLTSFLDEEIYVT